MRWTPWLVLLSAAACGDSPLATDAGPNDAGLDKKTPPVWDAGELGEPTGPAHLADTGLYADDVIPYGPRYPVWSDGAVSRRWLHVPKGTKIDTSAMDDWVFPVGTKAWKEFSFGGKLVETRFLWKVNETDWWESAYAWNESGTDAIAVPDGVPDALGTTHEIPNQSDCEECHGDARDALLGVSAIQLGASDGDGTLAALAAAGMLTTTPAPAYDVPGAGVTKDALGYLHANCGHCHSATGDMKSQTAMRLRVYTTQHAVDETDAYRTSRFLVMRHPIPEPDGNVVYALLPGAPDRSGIAVRMAHRDVWAMPPEGTSAIDDAGLATVRAWIASMPCGAACNTALVP